MIRSNAPGRCAITSAGSDSAGEQGADGPDAKGRKAYNGTSPITRASGTRRVVLARYARNRRLGGALQQ